MFFSECFLLFITIKLGRELKLKLLMLHLGSLYIRAIKPIDVRQLKQKSVPDSSSRPSEEYKSALKSIRICHRFTTGAEEFKSNYENSNNYYFQN